MLLITLMTSSYCCLWFLPMPEPETTDPIIELVYNLNDTVSLKSLKNERKNETSLEKYNCHWNCSSEDNFQIYLSNTTFVDTIYVDEAFGNASCSLLRMDFGGVREGRVLCSLRDGCNLLCFEDFLEMNRTRREISNFSNISNQIEVDLDKESLSSKHIYSKVTKVTHRTVEEKSDESNFYMKSTFWIFVVLMCVGTVAFNVANCIGDAVCFDVLGKFKCLYIYF
jgi:hypothetical protein